ncbi:MAG: tryptophan synthase subunit alpha [Planctomycetota bacterium]|jgi:tryptophan synthase alpha chain|nr:tryptophan synthase subunit alpha [Planctomycetota bacterium]
MPDCKLMAHWVAGYPNREDSLASARALAQGGADYLEIQFPFSDPSADGPLIENAGRDALESGFRVSDGFAMVRELSQLGVPVFIMTYGSLVVAPGTAVFVAEAAKAGARGLVVPDLPPDHDEGLFLAGKKAGLAIVPVVAPEISEERLEIYRRLEPEWVYAALRLGITGSRTVLDQATLGYLERLGKLGGKLIAGFGVRQREQIDALSGQVHAVAVGSHFLECFQQKGGGDNLRQAAANLRVKGEKPGLSH